MYTAQEYLYILQESKEEAQAEGIAKGIAEGKAETAKNMLAAGLDINLVVSCTGLSEAEVAALQ